MEGLEHLIDLDGDDFDRLMQELEDAPDIFAGDTPPTVVIDQSDLVPVIDTRDHDRRDGVRDRDDDSPPPVPPRPRKRGRRAFRMAAKKFYLTYPRCDVEPSVVLGRIEALPGGVKWAVVGREKHADGGLHLHCAFWLNDRLETTNPHFFDALVGGAHGNYQVMAKPPDCVKYCIKDDDFIASEGFDAKAYITARKAGVSTGFATVAVKVKEGTSLAELNDAHPGFMLQHLTKVKTYAAFCTATIPAEPLVAFPADLPDLATLNDSEAAVFNWLRGNLIGFPARPRFRSLQLMIIGGTGIGKSSLVDSLSRFARPYHMPMEESFYDSYSDKLFDFVFLDEFRSQKTISFMNSFVDGSTVTLRIKGGQVTKRKNLPVIICSNWEPALAYHKVQAANPEVLDAFMRRFLVVRVPAGDTFYTLCDYFLAAAGGD